MQDYPSIAIAFITGFLSGLLLSIPIGPVNLTIINEGARRGFRFGVLVGLGASTMEIIYCSIAFTGFASFFMHGFVKAVMEVFSFAFLIVLGTKFLLAQSVPHAGAVEQRLEKRFHPHSAYMTGFLRVLGNPGVLIFWIILSANFVSRDWVPPQLDTKTACIAGVALGTNLWFCCISHAVSRGHKKFSEQTLLRMERGSGLGLLILGLIHGCQLVWQLTRARHQI
ncbi:MAG TPA: LysE family transporter [Verrucomicrobiae bacterium]|jgi:threonine/homoserine/homoserine lactone efflux protein|nr:LysE family transporter [Verrucomicrobiae bacterium]